jgi:outer membrane receptor protein involved in Fe transport
VALAVVPAAFAEEPSASVTGGPAVLDEIVVTAQKRSERILDVPVAVSTVDSQSLVQQNLDQLSDYYQRVPGLQYGGTNVSDLSLRGITTGGNGSIPTLAILVDDVPFGGSSYIAAQPIPDFDPTLLDHVEVLKGPQGTLYGASSLGGLIKFATRDPDTHEWFGRAELGGNAVSGGSEGWSGRGAINVPLISDQLALNASIFYRREPRYINLVPSPSIPDLPYRRDVNKNETWGGRTELLWKPIDILSINLSAMRQETKTEYGNTLRICPSCQIDRTSAVAITPLYGNDNISLANTVGKSLFTLYSGKVSLDLGWGKLTSVTAYNESYNASNRDLSSVFCQGFLCDIYAPGGTVGIAEGPLTNKFSQELRLGSQGKVFDWLVGGFFTREASSQNQTLNVFNPGGAFAIAPYTGINDLVYKEKAGFADVTLHASTQLDVQVGARYSSNTQTYTQSAIVDPMVQPIFGNGAPVTLDSRDHATTWLVTPSYHFTPDMMAYLRVASGYRPGGPNTSVPTIPLTFGPDRVVSYEAGFKGYVIPRQLSLDASVFQVNWKDVQLQDTDAASQFVFFTNGGTARSRGLETTALWAASEGLNITASVTYTDAVLTQNLPPSDATTTRLAGKSGERLPFSAKFTANLDAQQDFKVTDRLGAYVGINYSYVGDRYSGFLTSLLATDPPGGPRILLPSYNLLDLRGGFTLDRSWHLNMYVRNVTNEKGALTATNRGGTSAPMAVFLTPLTYGLTVSKDFGAADR